MNNTSRKLLVAVKKAVTKYGLAAVGIRSIGELAEVNDALIYHYYKDKQDLLQRAYEFESEAIFSAVMKTLEEVRGIPFSFRDKARLSFHKCWRELLSDPDRLTFVTSYYHSSFFKPEGSCHERQVRQLRERLGDYFDDEERCVLTMYLLMSILYDSTKRIIDGVSEDTPETEEQTFSMSYALLASQLKTAAG